MDFGIPELTEEQYEEVTQVAENAARKYVFSRIGEKLVDKLNISVEAEGANPVNFAVEVEIELLAKIKNLDEKVLANEAVAEAFNAIEAYLGKATWHSKK